MNATNKPPLYLDDRPRVVGPQQQPWPRKLVSKTNKYSAVDKQRNTLLKVTDRFQPVFNIDRQTKRSRSGQRVNNAGFQKTVSEEGTFEFSYAPY